MLLNQGQFPTCPPPLNIWQYLEAIWLSQLRKGSGREGWWYLTKDASQHAIIQRTAPHSKELFGPKVLRLRNCFRAIVISLCSILESPWGPYVPTAPRPSKSESLSSGTQASVFCKRNSMHSQGWELLLWSKLLLEDKTSLGVIRDSFLTEVPERTSLKDGLMYWTISHYSIKMRFQWILLTFYILWNQHMKLEKVLFSLPLLEVCLPLVLSI